MNCAECGKAFASADLFCSGCGTKVAPLESVAAVQEVAAPKQQHRGVVPLIRIGLFFAASFVWIAVPGMVAVPYGGLVAQNLAFSAIGLIVGHASAGTDMRRRLSHKAIGVLFLTFIPVSMVGMLFEGAPDGKGSPIRLIFCIVLGVVWYRLPYFRDSK